MFRRLTSMLLLTAILLSGVWNSHNLGVAAGGTGAKIIVYCVRYCVADGKITGAPWTVNRWGQAIRLHYIHNEFGLVITK